MTRLFTQFRHCLEWIYPSKCGLCGALQAEPVCPECSAELVTIAAGPFQPSEGSVVDWLGAAFAYSGRARQAVMRLKYERATCLSSTMSALMIRAARATEFPEIDFVVPVPIHWRRRCDRGFNQSELLCEEWPLERVSFDVLARIRATRPQVGLTLEERRNNLKGAFHASPSVAGKSVILIDDVYTSGGTVNECAKTLKQNGARWVGAYVFASGDDIP